jgi:hypothetical protein
MPEPLLGSYSRPEIPPQHLEKIESAPGIPAGAAAQTTLAPFQTEEDRGEELEGLSVPARQTYPDRLPRIPGSSPARAKERPGIPAQDLEKIDSAPGIGDALKVGAKPGPCIETDAADGNERHDRTCWVVRQPKGRGWSSTALPGDDRPENPAQRLEKAQSAPETGATSTGVGRRRRRSSTPSRALIPNRARSARRATPARKFLRKGLKRLNLRPGAAQTPIRPRARVHR